LIPLEEVLHIACSGGLGGGDMGVGGGAGLVDLAQLFAEAGEGVADAVEPGRHLGVQRGIVRLSLDELRLHHRQLGGVVMPALDREEGEGQHRQQGERRDGIGDQLEGGELREERL
jgi:hypothetical protein